MYIKVLCRIDYIVNIRLHQNLRKHLENISLRALCAFFFYMHHLVNQTPEYMCWIGASTKSIDCLLFAINTHRIILCYSILKISCQTKWLLHIIIHQANSKTTAVAKRNLMDQVCKHLHSRDRGFGRKCEVRTQRYQAIQKNAIHNYIYTHVYLNYN